MYNFDKFFRALFCACGQSFVLIFSWSNDKRVVWQEQEEEESIREEENENKKTEPTCVGKKRVMLYVCKL